VPVVFGGPGVGAPEVQDFVLPPEAQRAVDAIVIREGEVTAVELAGRLEGRGIPAPGALADIAGVAALGADGRVLRSERPLAKAMDDLPRPSFTGFPVPEAQLRDYGDPSLNKFKSGFFVGSPLATTRGCVKRCSYCSEAAYWERYRQRSVDSVLDELDTRAAELGASHFLFCESALNGRKKWLHEFCERAAGRGYTFLSYFIANKGTDRELGDAMVRAGFKGVTLGVETFSERILENVRKNLTRADIDESLESLTGAGLHLKVNVLCGFPGETEADHDECVEALNEWVRRDTNKMITWDAGHPVRVEPYSPYWHNREQFGITIQPYTIDLPESLGYPAEPLSQLTYTWDAGLFEDDVARRSGRIKQVVAG